MESSLKKMALLLSLPLLSPLAYAAQPVNLSHQPMTALHSFMATHGITGTTSNLVETKRSLDANKTLHVRLKQTYQGYPVFGADAVLHIKNGEKTGRSMATVLSAAESKGSMNGTLYQAISRDLVNSPSMLTNTQHIEKAIQTMVSTYYQKIGAKPLVKDQHAELMVYVDKKNHTAHWAYKITFFAEPASVGLAPAMPVYLVDALSLEVYRQWDDIKTLDKVTTFGGGFGGNTKMGKLVYDGLAGNLRKLDIQRDASNNTCYLQNDSVVVKKYRGGAVMSFTCDEPNNQHDNVFWNANLGQVNGGYSPSNDALHAGAVIKHMYLDWYGLDALVDSKGKPMMLTMIVHYPNYDNAYWDGSKMTFGDGASIFYPLTSLGVAAHEISHGFTQQHSDLNYDAQSGGMNEAFSDMAAQAAEVYSYGPGKNSWQIGPEIFKAENEALRYMDKPSKDCGTRKPGNRCSIDDASQYTTYLDVHYSSGVYNRFFYLLGTTDGWDAKKAFQVMVQANANYWTADTTFSEGACGVISAANDFHYDVAAVKAAFDTVKVDYSACDSNTSAVKRA